MPRFRSGEPAYRPLCIATLLITAAVLGWQLLIPPRVGLSNNGDFGKVTGSFALHAPAEDESAFADLKWRFDPQYRWQSGYYSVETLLAAIGIGLGKVFDGRVFDIRWMGIVHGFLFLVAIYLLQPLLADCPLVTRALISIVVLVVFADFNYTSLFNSFYMDAATYVSLMLTVVLFLRAVRWRRRRDAIAMLASAVFMVWSKPQHAVLGIWIAVLLAALGGSLWPRRGRTFAAISTAVVVLATAVGLKGAAPADYAAHGYYTVIFLQVLPHSSDVDGDLRVLGLDASYKRWIGTHAYSPEGGMSDPDFVNRFVKRTSYARLGWYFLTHPRNALLALETSMAEAGRARPPMGNFDRSGGLPPYSKSHAFSLWSDAKGVVFSQHGGRYLAWSVSVTLLFVFVATARHRFIPVIALAGAYTLAAMAMTAILEASLADAVEVTRHHLIAAALLDLELVLALVISLAGHCQQVHRLEG